MRELFAKALILATEKHVNQIRRDGSPYIYHPIAVANILRDAGYGLEYQIVALLHDVLEDTDTTEEELLCFGPAVVEAVKLLTRDTDNEEEYVARILKNRLAAVVKNADKINNLHDALLIDGYGNKRTPESIKFATKYIKKTKRYYEGKFTPALDRAIGNAKALLHYTTVFENEQLPAKMMRLYPDIAKDNEKKCYIAYHNCDKYPDFAKDDLTFFQKYTGDYYCMKDMDNSWSYNATWALGKAGWLPTKTDIKEYWDDYSIISLDDMKAIISKLKDEGYFYEFVERPLI